MAVENVDLMHECSPITGAQEHKNDKTKKQSREVQKRQVHMKKKVKRERKKEAQKA